MTNLECNCQLWARDGTELIETFHHKNCEKYDPNPEIRELLLRVLDGIESWASDEDGVHYDCWQAYKDACVMVGQFTRPNNQEEV